MIRVDIGIKLFIIFIINKGKYNALYSYIIGVTVSHGYFII